MKQVAFLFIISTLMISCSNSKKVAVTAANTFNMQNPVIAHRGAWKKNNLPENSVASLKAAIALGCAGSEFDVRMTADDSLVINHDPAYHGLIIEKSTYQQLTQYQLSNGEKIPTLHEYITAGLQNNAITKLIIEIKPSDISKDRALQVAEKVVALIERINAKQMVQYISFDYDILKKINSIDSTAITQYLEGDHSPDQLKADGIKGADFHFTVYKDHPDWIAMALKSNLLLNAWTVNNETDMLYLLKNGIQYLTTNEPELAFRVWDLIQRSQ